MEQLLVISGVAWLAGIASFFGGLLAKAEGTAETESKQEFVHGVVAFGGGILVAAVAFALVPHGMEVLHPMALALTFCAGGMVFCIIDILLAKHGGNNAQFLAMLMDFIPEAIAMGAIFVASRQTGILLALFIGAQNLPEGFNAFRESIANGQKPRKILVSLAAISLLGPLAACSGYLFLQNLHVLTAIIMTFAGGGILYLIFQDIAPQVPMRHHWKPSIGAVFGFMIGMVGQQLLG